MFVVAGVLAVRGVDLDDVEVHVAGLVAVTLIGPPLTIVANAGEFVLASRLAGQHVGGVEAARVTVLASAANVLPVPGAALVRIQAMRRAGAATGLAVSLNVVVALVWLGTGLVAAGILQVVDGRLPLGAGVLVAGVALTIAGAVAVARSTAGRLPRPVARRAFVQLVGVELVSLAAAAIRVGGVLAALGFSVTVGQAVAVAVSGILASAVGFFPGGLGLREVLAGGIGEVVGLAAASATLAAVIDRLLTMSVLGVATAVLLSRRRPEVAA